MSNVEENLKWLLEQGYGLSEAQWNEVLPPHLQYSIAFSAYRDNTEMTTFPCYGPTFSAAVNVAVDVVKGMQKRLSTESNSSE